MSRAPAQDRRVRAVRGAAIIALVISIVGLVTIRHIRQEAFRSAEIARHLDDVQLPRPDEKVPCPGRDERPVVLLVLGQSNAGNHGEHRGRSDYGAVWYDGACYAISDPLPGATGTGGSIWSRLASRLHASAQRNVELIVLAVDASSIVDWTTPGALDARFRQLLHELARDRIRVSAVLWQQGEADARRNTTSAEYADRLRRVVATIRSAGVSAPVVLAQSTRCRGAIRPSIRDAIAKVAAGTPGLYLGPDTDALGVEFRVDGCHFSGHGLDEAARLWERWLVPHLAMQGATRSARDLAWFRAPG